jgi:uncharacterized membrane protein YeaQ/YmgE (transglycosylase-associated protein family)
MTIFIVIGVWALTGFLSGLGSAASSHFENLWVKKNKSTPDDAIMLAYGLSPLSRRLPAKIIFIIICLIVTWIVTFFSNATDTPLFLIGIISGIIGYILGTAVHYFGEGKSRIKNFFDSDIP